MVGGTETREPERSSANAKESVRRYLRGQKREERIKCSNSHRSQQPSQTGQGVLTGGKERRGLRSATSSSEGVRVSNLCSADLLRFLLFIFFSFFLVLHIFFLPFLLFISLQFTCSLASVLEPFEAWSRAAARQGDTQLHAAQTQHSVLPTSRSDACNRQSGHRTVVATGFIFRPTETNVNRAT